MLIKIQKFIGNIAMFLLNLLANSSYNFLISNELILISKISLFRFLILIRYFQLLIPSLIN